MSLLEAEREQTRARYPDAEGYVEREGVRVFYEVYGDGEPTVFLLPTWSIVHSRVWKLQIPYLARHYRVITFDPRGNGKSDRPIEASAYDERELAADALTVLDATETERAVVVSFSLGAHRALLLAARHPNRVAGAVFICPSIPLAPRPSDQFSYPFEEPFDTYHGWAKVNRHYWLVDFRGFLEFFFSQMFTEPHSTKQIEDCVGWGLETTPEVLIATAYAAQVKKDEARALSSQIASPVLVLQGTQDAIEGSARGIALAQATGGKLVLLEGSGHGAHARDPVRVNLLIRDFVESLEGARHEHRRRAHARADPRPLPDEQGYVERDGVRVFWEGYGDGPTAVLLFPTSPISHSRLWKAQIPYLARRHRVLTFDPRGNGRSDRPADGAAYGYWEYVEDGRAVLAAAGVDRAILVGLCDGGGWALMLASRHPETALGVVALAPCLPYLTPPHSNYTRFPFAEPLDTDEGWAKYNLHYWRRDFRGFLEFFFSQQIPEPHSTKQIEDCVGWGLETDPETLALADEEAPLPWGSTEEAEALCKAVSCPVLVVHGELDACQTRERAEAVAALTGGTLVGLEGAGHLPQARHPVKVNLLIRDFVASLERRTSWSS